MAAGWPESKKKRPGPDSVSQLIVPMATVTIHRRNVRQSPQKLRLVTRLINKRPVDWALLQLEVAPKRAAQEVAKAIQSAKAAARQKNLVEDRLMIAQVVANPGPALKRILPGPRGRTYRIKKMTSHLSVTVSDGIK